MQPTQTMNGVAPSKKRCGCFPAKIGAMFAHRLEQPLTLPSGRFLKTGLAIHLALEDITRHPEAEKHTHWICLSPHCTGKHWESKKALVAAHPNNKELERQEETHCFYAVAWLPGVPGVEEKKNKDGSLIQEAEAAKLPTIMLLSDEE